MCCLTLFGRKLRTSLGCARFTASSRIDGRDEPKRSRLQAQYLTKGRQIYMEGRLQTRAYVDKAGVKWHSTAIVAHHVDFLGCGENRGGERAPPPLPGS